MKISVQTDIFNLLEEAVESKCDKVRFGAEFCEWKIREVAWGVHLGDNLILKDGYNGTIPKEEKKDDRF